MTQEQHYAAINNLRAEVGRLHQNILMDLAQAEQKIPTLGDPGNKQTLAGELCIPVANISEACDALLATMRQRIIDRWWPVLPINRS